MELFKKIYRPVVQDGVVISEEVKPKNNKAVTPVIVLPTLIPAPTLEPSPTARIVPERILVITTRLPTPTMTRIPTSTPTPEPTETPTIEGTRVQVQRG